MKKPYPRYRIINSCLTSKRQRYWSLQQLIDKLAEADLIVEKRALQYDIENMRYNEQLAYKAPIAYCTRNKGYYYTRADYSIDIVPLNNEDLRSLTFAVNVLQRYAGAQVVKNFEGTLHKVARIVHQMKDDSTTRRELMSFEKSPYYKGLEFFDDVLAAVDEHQPLNITYRKFNDTKGDTHLFHPYLLKEYMSRWYVLGYSEARKTTITLGLDRIEHISIAEVTFRKNEHLDAATYFHHTIGITHASAPLTTIVLRFTPAQANYVRTRHLHHTQTTIHDDACGLTVSLELIPNYELASLLLSFGPEVEVIEPLSLREQVKNMLQKSIAIYQNSQSERIPYHR